MNPSNTIVVVSTYKKSVPWVDKLKEKGFEVRVYTKENPDSAYNIPVNKGQEASTYLKYIIDNYDCLPEYSILLHDHEYSYHQDGSILDAIQQKIDTSELFFNFNKVNEWEFYGQDPAPYITFYDTYLQGECGDLNKYGEFLFNRKTFAQFLLHRSLILKRTKAFYVRLYEWILLPTTHWRFGAMILEIFWDIIFDQVKPIDYFPRVNFIVDEIPIQQNMYYASPYIKFSTQKDEQDNTDIIIYIDKTVPHVNYLHIYSNLFIYGLTKKSFKLTLSCDVDGQHFYICSKNTVNEQYILNEPDITDSFFLGNSKNQREHGLNRFQL